MRFLTLPFPDYEADDIPRSWVLAVYDMNDLSGELPAVD